MAGPVAAADGDGAAHRPPAVARQGSPALDLVAAPLRSPGRAGVTVAALLLAGAFVLAIAAIGLAQGAPAGSVTAQPSPSSRDVATVVVSEPATLDPALQSDLASAIVISQLFEGVTAFDPGLNVRPALASSWEILDGGRRIVFHLRPDAVFSDGTPLRGADVVRSWMRLVDPASPSPLASLMSDVVGADDFRAGRSTDPASVGLAASGTDVEVRLARPATDFPGVVASAPFLVVPPRVGTDPSALLAEGFVGSGGYVLVGASEDGMELRANDRYWAGRPPIGTIHMVTSLGGRSPVVAFEQGDVDYVRISDADAAWIAYDRTLGPNLRSVPSLGVTYYGFNTQTAPFNDVRVRRAFAQAVDWKRLVALAGPASQVPATSMVPPGIPHHPARDFGPTFNVEAARKSLADAGYPRAAGFPDVTLVTDGGSLDEGILDQLKANLGITVTLEWLEDGTYFDRLKADVPAFWILTWIADYPGANDFLGVLLGSGRTNNYGHWSSPEFDAAIAAAGAAVTAGEAAAAYEAAQAIVQRDAPVIPTSYGTGWALSRSGLLGTTQNGLGVPRLAGLTWAP